MDSLSQIALGAAVGVAVMGRRTAVWKAAAWGALAGTLPDLDVLIDYGEPIANMVMHRGNSHGLFWLTLFSLPLALLVARISGDWPIWRRWWLALWLVLITHPLLDVLTIYGTQLAMPFSNYPYGVGSVFVIDPLYTLPLLVGTVWALVARRKVGSGLRANAVGLILSTVYLVWGVAAQQHVSVIARAALQTQGIAAHSVLVTPTPLNTVLWRVVALSEDDAYYEGFYSLLDAAPPRIEFAAYPRGKALDAELDRVQGVQRLRAFTKGFYALRQVDGQVHISDLRMGQEPDYAFTFAVASKQDAATAAVPKAVPDQVGGRGGGESFSCSLSWLRQRILGVPLPPAAQFCQQAAQKR